MYELQGNCCYQQAVDLGPTPLGDPFQLAEKGKAQALQAARQRQALEGRVEERAKGQALQAARQRHILQGLVEAHAESQALQARLSCDMPVEERPPSQATGFEPVTLVNEGAPLSKIHATSASRCTKLAQSEALRGAGMKPVDATCVLVGFFQIRRPLI